MKFSTARIKQASLAVMMLSSALAFQSAYATVGETSANTDITNKATIKYSVSGVSQTDIESSPTGNANPGLGNGTNTTFKVDRKVLLTLSAPVVVTTVPGKTGVVATFTVRNDGNDNEGFTLAVANDVGTTVGGNTDNQQMNSLQVYYDVNGNGAYDPGTDIPAVINSLARDTTAKVIVVGDVPATATNGQYANVTITVTAAVAGTNGATLETQTAGANTAGVDVVFVNAPDGSGHAVKTASDTYAIQSAALTVTKAAAVTWDPINLAVNPKNIPLAEVEYTITVANTGASQADTVGLTDQLDANTTFKTGGVGGADIQIVVSGGGGTTTCTAAIDGDGCSVTAGGLLTIGTTSRPNIAAGQNATIKFHVNIK